MKFKNSSVKAWINVSVFLLVFLFQSSLSGALGSQVVLITIPVAFSIVFYLLNLTNSDFKFSSKLMFFFVSFGLIYYLFNRSQPSFDPLYYLIALLIALVYVYVQEKLVST